MNTLMNDIRFGLRMLWKHRLASLVCVIALGLGMGATAAIFSMAEAFLLHPVPIPDVSRIVALVDTRPQENVLMNAVAPASYLDWQQQARSFEKMGAYRWDEVNFSGDGTPQRVEGFDVSPNFFSLLGVQPALGRAFLPEEGELGQKSGVDPRQRALAIALRVRSGDSGQDRKGERQSLHHRRRDGQRFYVSATR